MAVDHARAAEFYQRACDAKNGPGCRNLAALYGSGRGAKEGIAKDPAKAAEYHARGCDLKHAESCYYLGIDHQMGDGVAKNDTRAAELYTIACHAGYAEACNNLGYMYEQGLGVTRDLSKAREIFRQACASGVASGCSSWAFRLQAAPADLVRAAILYRLGCDLGDKHACTNLKSLPEQRSRSFAKRARVVRAELDRDCSEGSAESCRLAGVLLQNGIGIPPEPVEARDRFEKGCQFLDRLSCDALKKTDEGKDGPP
jgi:TPR repeat protein